MLTRPVPAETDTTQGDLIGNFDKLVSHIDWHVTGIDNALGMRKALKLFLGSDIQEACGKNIKKEEKRRENKTFRLLTKKSG